MAKRFTISLPDELAQRIEPFKDQLSLSAIMQKSLEAELAQLLKPKEKSAKAQALLKLAEEYYKEKYSTLVKTVSVIIDHLIEQAILDSDKFIFNLYSWLESNEIRPDTMLAAVPEFDERICNWTSLMEERDMASQNPNLQSDSIQEERTLTSNQSDIDDARSALGIFWHGDAQEMREWFPGEGTWSESNFLRVTKIVIHERLRTLLGEDAMKAYLTWQSDPGLSSDEA